MNTTINIGLLAAALLGVGACSASTTVRTTGKGLPSPEALIERHIEATGGRAAHEQIHNRVTHGRAEMRGFPQHDWTAKFVRYEADPSLWSETLSFRDWENREGTDGTVGWGCGHVKYPQYPDRLKEPAEMEDLAHLAIFNGHLSWQERYESTQPVQRRTVDGTECYELLLVPREGEPVTWYLDVDKSLVVKSVARVGDTIIETFPSDYRKIDGVMVPHTTRRMMWGGGPGPNVPFLRPVVKKQDLYMIVESVRHNVGDHHDGFEPPLAIRDLLTESRAAVDN